MPTVNDEFNRTCVRLDLDPERSGIFTQGEVALQFSADDLRVFNQCAQRIAPGTPPLAAEQLAAAARRLARAIGQGNESRFIQIRMRRAGEVRAILMDDGWTVDPAVVERMQDLIGYLDGPVALVPLDVPAVGGLDRALLVDMSMESLRAELDEYADFCRYRLAEAQRLGVAVALVDIDRERWALERSEELRLERLVRRGGGGYAKGGQAEVFRVS
ncbi:MAG: hypothetical protein EPN40_09370 [Rhodanobacteraceae bacterium]|nr:MAG: hypothetical protein EPN40_09370 [Rhodanobacteraceae bacterium]